MIQPLPIKPGDKIGIVAPAKFIAQNSYPEILNYIEKQGFIPVRGKTTFAEFGPFAGSDTERAADLQQMLDDQSIKAILCLRGGYGTVRIIEYLNFDAFVKKPKWLVGFSDITVLHAKLHQLGVESIHGQMPVHFNPGALGIKQLFQVLQNKPLNYTLTTHPLNKCGENAGLLVGGNLAILTSLLGTPFQMDYQNKLLFIEEVGEYLYRFDRMMYQLKLSGILNQISGLIVGGLTAMEDNEPAFGQSAEQIISDLLEDTHYPVCFGFPAGHIANNQPLVFGRNAHLNVNDLEVSLKFD
jgi:muramoyltetrapeptide carboxypeptidase